MRKLLEKRFFPYVIKPGRYTGGEPGQIVKETDGRLKYLHAFPDKYEIGQSYLGLQTLYHIVNKAFPPYFYVMYTAICPSCVLVDIFKMFTVGFIIVHIFLSPHITKQLFNILFFKNIS